MVSEGVQHFQGGGGPNAIFIDTYGTCDFPGGRGGSILMGTYNLVMNIISFVGYIFSILNVQLCDQFLSVVLDTCILWPAYAISVGIP